MKGPSGFGAPKRQRFAMQFGYDVRPSFWQELKSNSHLVIAAIGTVALLGVAGTALWLALPAGERQALAQSEQSTPSPTEDVAVDTTGQVAPSSAAPKDEALTLEADPETDLAALPANDPRWSGSTHKRARAAAEIAAAVQKEATPAKIAPPPLPTPEQAASVAAYRSTLAGADETHAKPDKAETAAIPTPKPAKPEKDESAAENGHILRAVTMRSGPKKAASAIGTIPAKAAVQVLSCKSWCNVVYNGKRGWIYKSFLSRH